MTAQPNTFAEAIVKALPEAVARHVPWLSTARRTLAERRLALAELAYQADSRNGLDEHLGRAAALEPNDGEFQYKVGELCYRHEDYVHAAKFFGNALDIDFSNLEALKGRGYSLDLTGDVDQAIYCYLRYLSERPDDPQITWNLIVALLNSGKPTDALRAAERAVERFPKDATFPYLAARAHHDLGDPQAAIASLQRALTLDDNLPDVHHFAGLVWFALGEKEKALASYQRTIDLSPAAADAYLDMSQALAAIGRYAEYLEAARKARTLYEQAGGATGVSKALWDEGWAYYKLGKWQESVATSTRALEIDPSLVAVRYNLGVALLRAGDLKGARETYSKAMASGDAGLLQGVGIVDLSDALAEDPTLSGGQELLRELQTELERLNADRNQGPRKNTNTASSRD